MQRTSVEQVRRADGRPRGPGVVHAALALVLVLAVATVALTSRQAPPPTIAEFAPQAVEQITDSSGDGSRPAGAGAAPLPGDIDPATGRPRDSARVDVARVRQCVGDPPRQIEDPQSPPCVPYWSGDNGGATTRGVTRDEIRVTQVGYSDSDPLMEAFFNRRFEFYGRRMRLIPRTIPADAAGGRAAARAAYEEDKPFASTMWGDWGTYDYFDELARLGIVAVDRQSEYPEPYLAAGRPYRWTYPMATDRLFATTGNWYCARLAGRNAVHAGDPVLQLRRRKPGIILTEATWGGRSSTPMNDQLAICGSRTDAVIESAVWDGGPSADTAQATFMENAMLQLKTAGVTTVACLCGAALTGIGMHAATNQGYFPEWLITTYGENEVGLRIFANAVEQRKNVMMLSALPMDGAIANHPSAWATTEMGDTSADSRWRLFEDSVYRRLLLLASGFQMAGPSLTPETFERGLHRAAFPNPPHRIMAGSVGFNDADHSMTDDVTEMWWSNEDLPPYQDGNIGSGPGTFCYVDHGARRRIGSFPTDDPFFSGECDNGT